MKLADYVVTEAGFGADLGLEKFIDIKCRKIGIAPDCAVLVATVRALKRQGGVSGDALNAENVAAIEKGFANLARHVENIRKFRLQTVVCLNRFSADSPAETAAVERLCRSIGTDCVSADHWARGSIGAVALARAVVRLIDNDNPPAPVQPIYPDDLSLWKKTQTIAREMYRADDIIGDQKVRDGISRVRGSRLWIVTRLYRENPVQFHDRSGAPGCPTKPCCSDPGGPPCGRRGVRGGHLRQRYDNAGAAQSAGGEQYRRYGGRPDHGTILRTTSGAIEGGVRQCRQMYCPP